MWTVARPLPFWLAFVEAIAELVAEFCEIAAGVMAGTDVVCKMSEAGVVDGGRQLTTSGPTMGSEGARFVEE